MSSFRLIGGPYRAPTVRQGERIMDAIHGDVVVCGISRALILVPRARRSDRLTPIVTGDLVRAIRRASLQALRHYRELSKSTASTS